jgi:dihydropteroate synthase
MSGLDAQPLIMGIVNVTPDSFSGDGLLLHADFVEQAVAQAEQMIADGAHILDIGGESSRPGSVSITVDEELRRIVPVITALHQKFIDMPLAIDTVKADVAEAALKAGASIINDITALAGDARMAEVAAQHHATVVLMHNRSHDNLPGYEDVVEEVAQHLAARVKVARAAGIPSEKIILDPGIGFGKTPQQNVELIAHMYHFKALGFRVLMGVSRKSFIGNLLDLPTEERLAATATCVTACVLQGADILRVHDVKFMAQTVKMATFLRDA